MINVDTVLFIETLRDLANRSKNGFVPLSREYTKTGEEIVYDDSVTGDDGYPIVIGFINPAYDTDFSTFRVLKFDDGAPYIIANVLDHNGNYADDGRFMIKDGEWFSI